MGFVSPGFRGRPRAEGVQLPPGQYLTEDFPVLSAGPTPRIPLDRWEFVITTEAGQAHRWSWPELLARRSSLWCIPTAATPTNLPLEDLLDGQAWIAYRYNGAELSPEHGGPASLL